MKKRNKTKLKIKWKNVILCLIILFSTISLIFCSYKIIKYFIDETKVKKEYNIIEETITITKKNTDNTDNIDNTQKTVDKENPYLDYITTDLIDVDFSKLKLINENVKGWIFVDGTNINYPFVQSNDNSYYLNHSFDNSKNKAGWIFLDYRNNLTDSNQKNIIIYGHGMKNKTMFGTLKNVLSSNWLNNVSNHVIKISTEYDNTLWQVFSVYHIKTTSDYIQTEFGSNNEFIEFTEMLIKRSNYNFNTTLSENDRILTLSSCYNDTEKIVLHAKLIKTEQK